MTLREALGGELCEYCDYNDGTCEGDCDGCDEAYENYKEQIRNGGSMQNLIGSSK